MPINYCVAFLLAELMNPMEDAKSKLLNQSIISQMKYKNFGISIVLLQLKGMFPKCVDVLKTKLLKNTRVM